LLTRLILPIALPVLAALAMAVWVINLSRAFLAGGKDGALVIVMLVTLTIVIGAASMSAATRLRPASKLMLFSTLLVMIIAAGFVTFGPSDEEEKGAGGGYQEPTGPAVATIEVPAGPGTTFGADEFRTSAGINEIDYIDEGSFHTLKFDDPKFVGFLLETSGKDDKGKVDLTPGEYTIYCTVPGHRESGMEATIIAE
jgi:plastocyanin